MRGRPSSRRELETNTITKDARRGVAEARLAGLYWLSFAFIGWLLNVLEERVAEEVE